MKEDKLIKVLHLEDDADDSELVLTILESMEYKIKYVRVVNENDFNYQLENAQFDIILADYNLPTFNGISALKICSEKYPDIPFIIVSGTLGEEIAVQMLTYGASDYLLKQNLKRLATAVVQSLEKARLKKDKLKIEKELRESEEKFRTITENSADAIFVVDQSGKYIFTNNKVTEILGYSKEEMVTKKITDLASEDQSSKFTAIFNKLISEGRATGELELLKKDGSFIPVDLNAVILPNGFLYGSCRDITERIRAAKDLESAGLRWASTFDAISDTVFIVSNDHKILAMNRAGIEKSSLHTENVIGRKCYEYIHNSAKAISNCPCVKARETGEGSSFEYERDERFYHLQVWPIPAVDGKFESFVHISKDITDKKQIQKTLEESEKKYRNIFENIQDVYFQLNNDGIITEISPSIKKVSGYSTQEIIGKKSTLFYHNPEERNMLLAELSEKSEVWDYEIRMKTKEGIIKYASLNAHLMLDPEGVPIGIEGLLRDIDERKHFEFKLNEAKDKAEESDRLKTSFLTNMSHEIRTPLNGILGFTSLLKEPKLSGSEQQEYISVIEKSGERMLNIISDIISISIVESGSLKTHIAAADVTKQIEFLLTFFKPEAMQKGLDIYCTKKLPPNESVILTDKEKLNSILSNLIKNAIKFTNTGSIEYGCEKKGRYLEYFVKDTGIGIVDEKKEIIFERFRQGSESHNRNYEGAGLGLSISKAYAEALGGKIWVESEEGKGSIFYFTVPYKAVSEAKNAENNAAIPDVPEKEPRKLKILIAENDETSELLIRILLSTFSDTILIATTGVEALEVCRNNPDTDLVLMDIKMPDMDGLEATMQIRKFNKEVIIIAQTAYGLIGDRETALEAGCNDYITKPFDIPLLRELIHKHFYEEEGE